VSAFHAAAISTDVLMKEFREFISAHRGTFLGHCEAMPTNRRFPPPWSVEDTGAAFVVKDGGGQKLGYFYYEEEAGRRSTAKMPTKDEARRIAANVAKLSALLRKPKHRRNEDHQ
jgi:hypothetical protein